MFFDRLSLTKTFLAIACAWALAAPTWLHFPGQRTPGPSKFAQGTISTSAVEYGVTFNATQTEIYFTRAQGRWGTGNMQSTIYHSTWQNGTWSAPEIVSFSGQFDDSAPHLTSDGRSIYFISNRPVDGIETSADIWVVRQDAYGHWGKPARLPAPINSAGSEYSPFLDGGGNLYFASTRFGGYGQGDLYMSTYSDGAFGAPQNLGSSINAPTGEWNVGVDKTGTILIFEASGRPDGKSAYGDLYISFKHGGQWSFAENLAEINTTGSDLYPFLHEQESTLFFTSSDSLVSPVTNIYSVDFNPILAKYRESAGW